MRSFSYMDTDTSEEYVVSIFRFEVCRDTNGSVGTCTLQGSWSVRPTRGEEMRPMQTVDRKMALVRATIPFSLSQMSESVTLWEDDPFRAPIWILTKEEKWNTEKQEDMALLRALLTEAKISPLLWGLRYRSVNSGGSPWGEPPSSFLQEVDLSFLLLAHSISKN